MGERAETVAKPYKIAVSVMLDVVRVDFICGDEYAAQVLHDDLIDRLRCGQGITISLQQSPTGNPSTEEWG